MKIFLDSDFADDSGEEIQLRSGSAKRRGGRPAQVDEGQLFNDRDRFIETLSSAWGEIGWELTVARTLSDLREAFNRLKRAVHAHEYLLDPFVRSTTVQASATDIRSTKEKRGQTVKRIYELMPVLEAATRRMQQSGTAVSQNLHSQHLKALLNEHLLRLADFRKTSREMDCLNRDLESLDTLIADQEAYYAQKELLDFIGYAKYAHTPRNLAQAMAGLPYIGCWRSLQLCEKKPSPLWSMRDDEEIPPLSYRVFLLIEECCNRRNHEFNNPLLDVLRERIRAVPQLSDLRNYLTENWRYLRQAVEETDLTRTPSGAVPYRILASFMKNTLPSPDQGRNLLWPK